MRINWRERILQHPHLADIQNWPSVSTEHLTKTQQRLFYKNQRIIVDVLSGKKFKQIAKAHNMTKGRISQLIARALGGDETEHPALLHACIPYAQLVNRKRTELPRQPNVSAVGCFSALLEVLPALRDGLDAMINAKLDDKPYAQKLTPQSLHGEFKRQLIALAWPKDCYPYTHYTLAKSSVDRYLKRRIIEIIQDKQSNNTFVPHRFIPEKQSSLRAMDRIQIDEHTVDVHNRIQLSLNDELIPLRISRVTVLLAVDVATECILGYFLAPSNKSVNQDCMLTLLDRCVSPWAPLQLKTPGLSYAPGPGFPNGIDNGLPLCFGMVQLDNAWMHLATSVKSLLTEQLGATLHYGLPKMPKVRGLVEHCFDWFERNAGHRTSSTAGSHPTDPQRESHKNAKKIPLMEFNTLDEIFSVMFVEYNQRKMASLGGSSPIEVFRHQREQLYVRTTSELIYKQWTPYQSSMEVSLHWYTHENRVPHVNFAYVRYIGNGLASMATKEKKLRISFDRRDIRTVEAYTLKGKPLGTLQAIGKWQRFPHSLATRKLIHKHIAEKRFSARDPLSGYFQHLLEHRDTPSEALSLLRVYLEYTHTGDGNLQLSSGDDFNKNDSNEIRNFCKPKKSIRWSLDIADQEGDRRAKRNSGL